MDKNKKIAVAGTGYVGLSIATLLSQHHQVTAVDVIPEKVDLINQRKSPIQDDYIEKYLAEKDLNLSATLDGAKAYSDADFVVIAAPTNYDPVKNYFDTSHVEEVIELVMSVNPKAIMVIKSTIPVGYTEMIRKKMRKTQYKLQKYSLILTFEDFETGEWKMLMPDSVRESLAASLPAILSIAEKTGKAPKYMDLRMLAFFNSL